MKAMRSTLFYVAACLSVCSAMAGLNGCADKKDPVETKPAYVLPNSLLKQLSIEPVSRTEVMNEINLTGKVSFNEESVVKVFPLVSGIAQDVKVALGDYVQKGQTLAMIRSSEMAGYSTDLITAEENLKVARKTLEQADDMYKSGLASAKDLLMAQSGYEQAKASLLKAHRVLQVNGGSTSGTLDVKAPISGFIVEKVLNNNMAIRPDNTSNLFTISDLKSVWVLANVYESNIPYIKLGDSVVVTTLSYPDRKFYGKVDKILNVLDPTNKVMKVRIVLNNPDYILKPEMFANVTVLAKGNGTKMLSVPSSALIFDNSQYYVLVYKSPSDISIRPVMVANASGERTYINGGLQEGEKVITSNALLIYQQLNT
jgi:membrane fusion protein, heavy metal efflux system